MKADIHNNVISPLAYLSERERGAVVRNFSKLPEVERLIIARDNPALYGYLKRQQQRSIEVGVDDKDVSEVIAEIKTYLKEVFDFYDIFTVF